MIINLQYKFKPENISPGPDGTEICVDKNLTEYAADLGLSVYVIQVWEGQNEDSHIERYIIFDSKLKKPIFSDHRYHVVEYILENIAAQVENNQTEDETQTSS